MPTDNQRDSTPLIDPTVLTTQQLLRELLGLRELLEMRILATEKTAVTMQTHLDQRQVAINTEMEHLQKLHEEKFHSIATQFKERDTRTDQAASTTKVAVDAALQAQKEAVAEQNKSSALAIAKSEAATMKQIDQIQALMQQSSNGLNDKIADLKESVTLTYGKSEGLSQGWAILLGGVAVVSALVTIFGVIGSRDHPSAPAPQIIYVQAPVTPAPIQSSSSPSTK